MFACGCPEERATRKRWAAAVRSLAYSTVKHDRAGEVANVVAACWGADNRTGTSAQCKRMMNRKSGRRPKCMTHHDGTWHIVGITVFDKDAHWGDPAHSEPDGDEQHEQGYIRAYDGKVAYDMIWMVLNVLLAKWRHRSGSCAECERWWTPLDGG